MERAAAQDSNAGRRPRQGDRILILREEWLRRILSEEKILEIRGIRYSSGDYWLGCKSKIYGKAFLGKAFRVKSASEWVSLQRQHQVLSANLPYKKTWAFPLQRVKRLRVPIAFAHPQGAVGIVKFKEFEL